MADAVAVILERQLPVIEDLKALGLFDDVCV
jgi:hypothetical protein